MPDTNPYLLRHGKAALPVTDDTWRVGDVCYVINEKTHLCRAATVTAIVNGYGPNKATLAIRMQDPPHNGPFGVDPAVLFKTPEAAYAEFGFKPHVVTFVMVGTKTIMAPDGKSAMAIANGLGKDDVDWDDSTVDPTDVDPDEPAD